MLKKGAVEAPKKIMTKKLKGIYAITPDIDISDAKARRRLLEQTERMLDSGLTMFQFRNKSPDSKQKTQLAQQCQRLCRHYHTPFIVNDDVLLAQQCDADGIHVGQSDSDVPSIREALGDQAIIGVSCHGDIVLADNAVHDGADYIAFGRFFPSTSKPEAAPADIRVLQRAKNRFDVPIVAIGGIREDNAEYVLHAGADILAMIDGLFNSHDLKATLKKLQGLFAATHQDGRKEPVSD